MSAFVPPPLAAEVELAEPPALVAGAMAHLRPFVAAAAHNQPLGFPGERVPDWEQRAVDKLGELLKRSRALRVFLDSCVKCGACADKCHFFIGTH